MPDLGPADIVDLYQDAHGQWRAIQELVLGWDTTVCCYGTYYVMGTVNCENLTSNGAVEVEQTVPPHSTFDIRNCLINSVETSAGNPDYCSYDPRHEDYAVWEAVQKSLPPLVPLLQARLEEKQA